MIDPALALPEPRSAEQRELNELLARRAAVTERLHEAETAMTYASQEYISAEGAVRNLEMRRARGDVPEAEAKKITAALRAAQARRDEPWRLRADGARAALVEAEREIGRFVAKHDDALMAEREREAREVAERVDRAAEELLAAVIAREGVAARVNALLACMTRVQPGDVHWSRAEPLATAARTLLESGGERPPLARSDPRQPVEPAMLPESDSHFAEQTFP